MPQPNYPDFANLEDAWEGSCGVGPAEEGVFYAGALAALWLLNEGRTQKSLLAEIKDWADCTAERMKHAAAN